MGCVSHSALYSQGESVHSVLPKESCSPHQLLQHSQVVLADKGVCME